MPELTRQSKLIVVMRADDASKYAPVIETLIAEGIRSFELTQTTTGTLEILPALVNQFGSDADIGVGTVTTAGEVDLAADGGADYVVTPVTNPVVIKRAIERNLAIIPGGLTPTELFSSWQQGAAAVKIFPANQVGPSFLKDLRGPFPNLLGIPSGGVDVDAAREWLLAGATAVSVGGPLVGDALKGGNLESLSIRAKEFMAVVREVSK